MKRLKVERASLAGAIASAVLIACVAVESRADFARVVERVASGEFEERNAEGRIVETRPDAVVLETADGSKLEIPSERALWLQFDAAPPELAAARVELEVGACEAALEKLDKIEESETTGEENALIAAEIEWTRLRALMQMALDGTEPSFSKAGKAATAFVNARANHYRRNDAFAMLGSAFLAMSREGKDPEKNLARAKSAYEKLTSSSSKTVRARGTVGLAELASERHENAEALKLYGEVAGDETLCEEFGGLEIWVDARLGLARVATEEGRYEEALSALTELLASTPNAATLRQARTYNALGSTNARAGRTEEAIVAYLHVDLLYPSARSERIEALKALVPLWRAVGREDRAEETRARLKERFGVEVE